MRANLRDILREGSSPRVRGKVRNASLYEVVQGIIPACAGKRRRVLQPWAGRRDHPRVCGEKTQATILKTHRIGSSPRVRGKVVAIVVNDQVVRIIPACAGKSRSARRGKPPSRDHPRVCGEKAAVASSRRHSVGSSPRVRGKERGEAHHYGFGGIIPACAGKSCSPARAPWSLWDHPRVCGEKSLSFPFRVNRKGSSPRVRGKAR